MKKLMGSLLVTSAIMLCQANLTYAVDSRLVKRSSAEVTAAQYDKASRLTDKAVEFERQASLADSDKERTSQLAKAKKQYKKAASLYKKVMRKTSSLSGIRTELGRALIKTGNYPEALLVLEEAIEHNSENTRTMAYRVEALIGMGQLDEAKMAYEELTLLDSPEAEALARRILISIKSGELASSQEIRSWIEEHQPVLGSST